MRTHAEVEQRLAELGRVAEGHLPGRQVRALTYYASTCPSKAAFPSSERQGRAASMEIEMGRGDERIQALHRMRDALRAGSWNAVFPSEVRGHHKEDYLDSDSPDAYHLRVNGETWDTTVTVDIEAPCFVLPKA